MALFKISKGKAANLANKPMTDGYAWFTPDDGKFYIDADIEGNGTVTRVPLNALKADQDSEGRNIKGTYSVYYVACNTSTVSAVAGTSTYTPTATFVDFRTNSSVTFADLSAKIEAGTQVKCVATVPGLATTIFGVLDVLRFDESEITFGGLGYLNQKNDILYQGYFTLNNAGTGSAVIKKDFKNLTVTDTLTVGNGCNLNYNTTTNCLTFSFI